MEAYEEALPPEDLADYRRDPSRFEFEVSVHKDGLGNIVHDVFIIRDGEDYFHIAAAKVERDELYHRAEAAKRRLKDDQQEMF